MTIQGKSPFRTGLLASLLALAPAAVSSHAWAQDEAEAADAAPAETVQAEETAMTETQKLSYAFGVVMSQQMANAFEGDVDPAKFAEGLAVGQKQAADTKALSYAHGVMVGLQMAGASVELDTTVLQEAMATALAGEQPKLSQQDIQMTLAMFQQRQQMQQQQKQAEAQQKALAEAAAYLKQAEQEEGVQKTDTGLLYKVVKMGDGPKPTKADTVKVHYEGRGIEGEVFDSSYRRGEPTEFPLARVVPGFSEGISLMPVGSTFELILPPDLAYGAGGPRPNMPLLFKVELLGITTADADGGIAPPPAGN